MRFLQALILLAFLGTVGIFAVQNAGVLTFNFLNWQLTGPVALLTIGIYLLGMLSGWTVVSFMRRSIRRVGEQP
jgi:putative membrane protein